MELPVIDKRNRPLRDLRISVTDRCNFRCTYCMPKEVFGRDYVFLERSSILDFEEITRLARIFIGLGVTKVRITGGEPLVRRNVESLVRMLADLRPPLNSFPFREGVGVGSALHDLTLTTNGSLLAAKAQALKDAGLDRVTVSVDSLDDAIFRAMNDVDFPVATVLEGIDAAMAAGLPVKVNMVVRRGVNEESILPMARRFHGSGCILRFIEYMDVGSSNHWRPDEVVPASEIVRRIDAEMPVEPVAPNYAGEVARRFRYRDGGGEIGMIASVTQPFCGGCTRARLTADGLVYTCLFATSGHDVRTLLRSGVSDEVIAQALRDIWRGRSDRYSELRVTEHDSLPKVEMSRIGG